MIAQDFQEENTKEFAVITLKSMIFLDKKFLIVPLQLKESITIKM